jgi:hypothetical protein
LTEVLAPAHRTDAEPFLDLADARLETGRSEAEVIDRHHGLGR